MRACVPVLGGPSPDLKDRVEGAERWKTMTLAASQFIRRFLIHVLPKGLQRIRHYGLLANGNRAKSIERARELLAMPKPEPQQAPTSTTPDRASGQRRACVAARDCSSSSSSRMARRRDIMSVMRHCTIALRWLMAGVVGPCSHACHGMKIGCRAVVATDFVGPKDVAADSTDRLPPSRQPASSNCAQPQSS
jgi:hypothetical protein